MASSREAGLVGSGLALFALGALTFAAWRHGLWATVAGLMLAAAWLTLLTSSLAPAGRGGPPPASGAGGDDEVLPLRLLLDQLPVPLLRVVADGVHALNGAARTLFATDDRVLAAPPALVDTNDAHVVHEGRRFRIDRVVGGGSARPLSIVALIDVEAEARTAEARATADMIQVLGHELLNGLAPIVSLAESGLAVIASSATDDALLTDILGTLARRTDGLLRFAEAYRLMARLPDPTRAPVTLAALARDLAQLFAGRWGDTVGFGVDVPVDATVAIDAAQITQAVWSLLQNGAEAALEAGGIAVVSLAIWHDSGRVRIDVTDTGRGLVGTDIDRAFRPFHTTKPAGTGVGLSLARWIAHAHGGDVRHVAKDRTTFRLEIAG